MTVTIDRPQESLLTNGPNSPRLQSLAAHWGSAVDEIRLITAISVWEIRSYFRRPVSYLLLLASTAVAGWNFSLLVTLLAQGRVRPLRQADDPLAQFLGPNLFLVFSLMLILPVVTMGLVAEERKRGLWEMLLTAPVQPRQVLWGKFAAAWCIVMANILPWVCFLSVLYFYAGSNFDAGHLIGGAAGLATVSLTLSAIGLCCSSLCRSPFAAAVTAAAAMIVLLLLSLLPRALDYWRFDDKWISGAERFACWEHLAQFSRGMIDLRIVGGHFTAAIILLWMAIHFSDIRD